MEGIYTDPKLNYPRTEFERPNVPLGVELDCSKFQQEIRNETNDYGDAYLW